MAVCVMNPLKTGASKANNYALKLLGINNQELSNEEILECLTKYIEPSSIKALLFDTFNNFYVVYLNDIDSSCRLVGKTLEFKYHCIDVYPLFECYIIDNVYPCVEKKELCDIFRTFGIVFQISDNHLVPNASKYSHVLSGKREISFLLPGRESEIYVPLNVLVSPYAFHVKKFCCACLTEGHSFLYCPDIEDDPNLKKIKFNDSNGTTLIKSEDVKSVPNYNDKDLVPDSQCAGKTPKKSGETSQENIEKKDNTKQDEVAMKASQRENTEKKDIKQDEVATEASEGVNTDNDEIAVDKIAMDKIAMDEIAVDKIAMDAPQDKKSPESKIVHLDDLTMVVSTAAGLYRAFRTTEKVCRFNSGTEPVARQSKSPVTLLPPLAEQLINEVCGSHVIESNVLKQLVQMDGRLKSEMIKFAFRYLEEIDDALKFLKQIVKQCHKNRKYGCLRGPFTSKVRRLHAILSNFSRKE